ncbi:hypothetical protein [Rubritalea marina]|uniref:hypothetical protein n=1 Tax=Rubritalea marina TaxID=361055 RepID=UPI000364003B|nr:hypothetical protein [Rubritalea marina]
MPARRPRHNRPRPARRHRPAPGRERLSLWESIEQANQRAHYRANQRLPNYRTSRSIHAAIAETYAEEEASDEYQLPTKQLILRSLIALLLLLPASISTLAIFTITEHPEQGHFWRHTLTSLPFLCFAVGCGLMVVWFWSGLLKNFFLYLYVLGHELTHVFFIFLCGGKISGFNVSLDGGYVMTNKTNILIALSPYFIPFWSFILIGISAMIQQFWTIPYHEFALYAVLGGSWTFHLTWTLWMIPRDQPDLKENGTFFSLVIIYMANVLLLVTLLCLIPGGLTFSAYAEHWTSLILKFAQLAENQLRHWI